MTNDSVTSDTASDSGVPPEWDLADRMRKGLRESGISVNDMAEYLGVSRTAVSSWINGRITPTHRTLLLWAMQTGVPLEWLTEPLTKAAS